MKKTPLSLVDYGALAAFRFEIRRFLNFSHSAAHAAGIEPQQHQALLVIKGRADSSDTTVGVLAEQLQIMHHSAVELSYRLEASGWIRRARSPKDRREVFLLLSPKGERVLQKLSVSHRDELQKAGPKLIETLRSVIAQRKKPRAAGSQRSRAR